MAASHVDKHGLRDDRRYTVQDLGRRPPRHLTAAEAPDLLRWSAGGVPLRLTDPSGHAWDADGPDVNSALTRQLRREVRLQAHEDGHQYVPGSVHITLEASRLALEQELGETVDLRRFRANLHLALDAEPFAEHRWCGAVMSLGGVTLRLLEPVQRCVIAARHPETGEKWPGLLQQLANAHNTCFGILAAPLRAGAIAVDDAVTVRGS